MAMNAFGIVKSFDVLEYQTICLPVVRACEEKSVIRLLL